MKGIQICILLLFVFLTNVGIAHHPNEGAYTLDKLISEALTNSRDIQMAKIHQEIVQSELSAQKSSFFPRISIEGGPQTARFDENKNSGTAIYGKAEWNLYNGGKDKANTEKTNIEKSIAEIQTEFTKANIKREVSKIYFEMLFILESISIRERAGLINEEQMKIAKLKKKSGFTSSADVIEFELREATIKSDLKKLKREKDQKSRDLSLLTGRDRSTEISAKGHLEKEKIQFDLKNAIESLDKKNPQIAEANLKFIQSLEEKRISLAGFRPQIDLEGRYGKLTTEERVFSDADNYSVALKIKIPLFSGMSTIHDSRVAQSKISLYETQLSKVKILAKTEIENLYEEAKNIEERMEIEEKNLAKAEEYYKLTLAEYKRGVKNSPDMVSASEKLLDSKIRNLELRKDFQLAKLNLNAVLGM